jgi:hypothetical protein
MSSTLDELLVLLPEMYKSPTEYKQYKRVTRASQSIKGIISYRKGRWYMWKLVLERYENEIKFCKYAAIGYGLYRI